MLKRVINYFPKKLSLRYFVSRNKKSHEEREKRELKKIEKFWESIDRELEVKRVLEKELEAKYKDQEYLIGNTVHGSQLVDIYYVPLTKEDEPLLDLFSTKAADDIRRGGRVLLLRELEHYSKEHPGSGVSISFIPMSNEDIKELKEKYYEIYSNTRLLEYALQKGKPFLEALNNEKSRILSYHNKFINHMNYIANYSQIKNPPFNTKIKIDFLKFEDTHYVKIALDKKFNETEVINNLTGLYTRYYDELIETYKQGKTGMNDTTLFNNNIESNLVERSKVFLKFLKLNNYTLNYTKDTTTPVISSFIDKVLVKGVNIDRENNYEAEDYIYIDNHEDQGIRYYMNKFYAGYASRYGMEKDFLTSFKKFSESDAYDELSFNIKQSNRKIILRVSMFIKHSNKLHIMKDGKDTLDYEGYSGKHLAVFENELIPPHHSYFIEHTFEDWLGRHVLDNNNWKLVDVDNFMNGNSYFKNGETFKEVKELELNNQLLEFIEKEFGVDIDKLMTEQVANTSSDKNKESIKPDNTNTNTNKQAKKPTQSQPNTQQQKKKANKEGRDILLNYRVSKIKSPQVEENDYTKIDKEDLPKIIAARYNYPQDRLNIIQSFIESIDNNINNNV